MSLRVVFRRAAQFDLSDAIEWYEAQRAGLGDEFIAEFEVAIKQAAVMPTLYPLVFGNVRQAATRRFPYNIYFRQRGESLVVIAVFHGRRDPKIWRRRT